jgi:hypothetical protein
VLVIIRLLAAGRFRSFLIGRALIAITGEAEWPTSDKGSKPKFLACVGTLAR